MPNEYMVGTVDDTPLLMITLEGVQYFVDVEKSKVFVDEAGLPAAKDKETVKAVLAAAKKVTK